MKKLSQEEIDRRQRDGKRCPRCQTFKTREHWSKSVGTADGLDSCCRECICTRSAAHYADNRAKINAASVVHRANNLAKCRAKDAAYYVNNRAKINAKDAAYRKTDRGRAVRRRINRTLYYGPNAPAVVDLLIQAQGNLSPLTGLPLLTPSLDHCHDSDLVRGVLNDQENAQLGRWGDSYIKAKVRLAAMKNKDGTKGSFLRQALKYFLVTPAMHAGLNWRVTGRDASLPESRDPKNLPIIRHANSVSLARALALQGLQRDAA